MDILKQAGQNLKSIGVGSAVPELRDNLLGMISGEGSPSQNERIKKLEAEIASGLKTREQAKSEMNMKKGGKVSSVSKRGDGCAQRGKTKGRFV